MFSVKFDTEQEWASPTIEAKCDSAKQALALIGSLKQDFGFSANEHNEWFLVTRLSDGKSCHPSVKKGA